MEHKKTKRIGLLLGVGIFAMPYLFCWLTLRDGYSTRARLASFMWMLFLLLFVLSGAAHANASGGMVVFLVAAFVIYKITPMLLRFFRHLLSPIAETSAAKNVMNAGSAFDMHVRNSVAAAGFDGSRVFDAAEAVRNKTLDVLDKSSKPLHTKDKANSSEETKTCQFCAETVKANAIRCKHCKSDI